MNLFVLVSTGQKVANLPPVLELAQPGDGIIWIESDEARRLDWTSAPRDILERYGLQTHAIVPVHQLNDPASLSSSLVQTMNSLNECYRYQTVYLVTNGGTKHTPIGLILAFRESHYPVHLLYGEERPVVYNIYPHQLISSPEVKIYQYHKLDLEDIIKLNGFVFAKGSEHTCIWPDGLTKEINLEPYGENEKYTYQLHEQNYRWSTANTTVGRVPFAQIAKLIPEQFARWQRTIANLRSVANPQNLESFYHATLNLAKSARIAASKEAEKVEKPSVSMGKAFERAVARRVYRWLQTQPHPAVQSVWTGVRLARKDLPEIVEAEFDLLIVLKNSILLNLECKSASADLRDVTVGVARLQQASSQLARTAVVVPLYTRCYSEPWFPALHNTFRRLEEQQGPVRAIPFTWPHQPKKYSLTWNNLPTTFECPSFEEALARWLQPYRL
jgi:hypothetical protein